VIRILIILLAGKGKTIAATAEAMGCCEQTVLNQRKRFLARRSEGPVTALEEVLLISRNALRLSKRSACK
jgi:hypothetical protein